MSNPAVTQLCRTDISGTPFWMDDNIGESIHIHIGDVRVDLTNKEFSAMCDDLCEAINRLIDIEGFDCAKLNPIYLQDMLWKDLLHLKRVRLDSVSLKEMLCPYNGDYQKLPHSRAVEALDGNSKRNDDIRRSHHIGQTSKERLDTVYQSIVENGYPFNGEYIIMYGDDFIIQDGQHRAACLWHLYGDISVPVMRFYFDNYVDYERRSSFQRSKFGYRFNRLRKKIDSFGSFVKKVSKKRKKFATTLLNKAKKKKYIKKYGDQNKLILEIFNMR